MRRSASVDGSKLCILQLQSTLLAGRSSHCECLLKSPILGLCLISSLLAFRPAFAAANDLSHSFNSSRSAESCCSTYLDSYGDVVMMCMGLEFHEEPGEVICSGSARNRIQCMSSRFTNPKNFPQRAAWIYRFNTVD